MSYQSRYFTQAELDRIIADTDRDLEQRAHEERLSSIINWIHDPRNKETIDRDPGVQKLRAMSKPVATSAPAAPAAPLQRIGFSNEAKDPYCSSPSVKSKSVPIRYGPGAPALPPGGFWVL
jgi:hypothetical protein